MMHVHQFRAMNTEVLLAAECPYPNETFALAQDFIERSEQRFTRFKESSELSALNRSAGNWFDVSPDMIDLLSTAQDCYRSTDGLFDPSILPDLQAVGYTQSIDLLPKFLPVPKDDHRSQNTTPPFSEVQLDPDVNRVRLPAGIQIDLGGIAKGWIAEKAARLMAKSSTAFAANAGGDIFLIGKPYGQTAWEIGLEDPYNPLQDLMILLVDEGAVVTSSVVKRSWFQGDLKRHHLIDPRTGESSETPWVSVSVFAPTAALAETFAKAILIAGTEGAQSLLDNNPEISFLALDQQKQLWISPTEKEKIYEYA